MTLLRLAAFGPRIAAFAFLALIASASQAQGRFTISGDGQEVTDTTTKLAWRRCAEGLRWDGKTCSGKLKTFKYPEAREAAAAAAKRDAKAWRIPTRDELVPLVDMSAKKRPRIDVKAFPQTPAKPFWAMRPGSDDDLSAWLVNFANGKVTGNAGQRRFHLRLVRAGA
jgi:Protein of unknown function (DUF1566)